MLFTIDFLFGNFNLRMNKRISVNTNIFKKNFSSFQDFKIIVRCPEKHLRILESIFIHDFKPCLNDQQSSYDLNILG